MKTPRTKKHIPTDRYAWEKEVAGINRFIERARHRQSQVGDAWLTSMLRYYRLRLDDLYDNEPPVQHGTYIY